MATKISYKDPFELSDEEALRERKRLAKILNGRMSRLKDHGITYGAVQQYNLLLEDWYEGDKLPTGVGRTKNVRPQAEVAQLQRIYEMPTSSLSGIRKSNLKRMQTLEERYGITFDTVNDFIGFYEYESYKKLVDVLGSKDALRVISTKQRDAQDVLADAEEYLSMDDTASVLEVFGYGSKVEALRAIVAGKERQSENLRKKAKSKRRY